MNAPSLLTRRSVSICLACRRNLLRQRQFSTTAFVADYQAYTLPSRPPSSPRNASVPDTSISHPVQSPPLPRIQQTKPPQQPAAGRADTTADDTPAVSISISEREAQHSRPEFAPSSSNSTQTSQSPSTAQAGTSEPAPSTAQPQQREQSQAQPSPSPSPSPRPRSKLRTPRKAAIKLTPAAVAQLRALLDQPEPKLIKIGVRNRGCSGLAYHLEYVDKAGAFDETVEQDGVRVLIDSKALFSIIGSEMDWVEDKLSQRFVFRNPNISECDPRLERGGLR